MDRLSVAQNAIFELKQKLLMVSPVALPVAEKKAPQTPVHVHTPVKPLSADQQEAILWLAAELPKMVDKLDRIQEAMARVGVHPAQADTAAGRFFQQIKNPLGTCCFTLAGVYQAMLDLYNQGGIKRVQ